MTPIHRKSLDAYIRILHSDRSLFLVCILAQESFVARDRRT